MEIRYAQSSRFDILFRHRNGEITRRLGFLKKSCSLKKRLVVCSFEIYQPVVTIYSFTKTIVEKRQKERQ